MRRETNLWAIIFISWRDSQPIDVCLIEKAKKTDSRSTLTQTLCQGHTSRHTIKHTLLIGFKFFFLIYSFYKNCSNEKHYFVLGFAVCYSTMSDFYAPKTQSWVYSRWANWTMFMSWLFLGILRSKLIYIDFRLKLIHFFSLVKWFIINLYSIISFVKCSLFFWTYSTNIWFSKTILILITFVNQAWRYEKTCIRIDIFSQSEIAIVYRYQTTG